MNRYGLGVRGGTWGVSRHEGQVGMRVKIVHVCSHYIS